MKKRLYSLIVAVAVLGFSQTTLSALPSGARSIQFGSRDSTIHTASGARFNVGSSGLSIDGTFKKDEGASITGNTFNFDNGVLSSGGLEAVMDGLFDPTDSDFIRLQGNGNFRAEPGTVVESLTVQGSGNKVEGQPQFSNPITMADGATELTLALQSALNQNIVMNGGTVKLGDDLGLNDDVIFSGSGTVELNNRQLRLGSVYTSSWSNSLFFSNAADIVLNGRIDLTGSWTFGGNSCLNGNGCILNMSGGGKLIVEAGATLDLNDIHITGLGDTAGRIIMNSGSSLLRTSNASFKLNDNVTTPLGTMYAFGPTTFYLGNKDWTFNNLGNLSVDGTTLWLDYLDSPFKIGTVNAPLPLFDGHRWNHANLVTDLASGNLSLTNRGTIKENVDMSVVEFSPSTIALLSGDVSGLIELDDCICLGADDVVRITGDAVIDGRGVTLRFTDPAHPQWVVEPGVSVTLKNINIVDINNISFDLRHNSSILIDQNVTWLLDQDFTFSSDAFLKILDTAEGTNVFKVQGLSCRRKFIINPLNPLIPHSDTTSTGLPRKSVILGHNTIMLENAQIAGFDYISYFNDDTAVAGIALSCNAGADIDSNFEDRNGNYGTAMNFFIEGLNNDIILRRDGLILFGNITFGNYPDNNLNFRFNIAKPFDPLTPGRAGVLDNFPFVLLAGDPGVYMWSKDGVARVDFADYNACVRNNNTNAFTVDDNSLLKFQRLQILDNPIKQSSYLFRFEGIELLGERIDPGFIRLPKAAGRNVLMTAAHIMRQKEKAAFMAAQAYAKEQAEKNSHKPTTVVTAPSTHKPTTANPKPSKPKQGKPGRAGLGVMYEDVDDDDYDNDDAIVRGKAKPKKGRAFTPPTTFLTTYNNSQVNQPATPLTGTIKMELGAVVMGMQVNDTDLAILTTGNNILSLGADVTLGANHKIYIAGKGNVIKLNGYNFTYGQDNLIIDAGAELTIENPENNEIPTVCTVKASTTMEIPAGAILRYQNPGKLALQDGVVYDCKGVKTIDIKTKAETVLSRGYLFFDKDIQVVPTGTTRVKGVGHCIVSNRAMVDPFQGQLVFGIDTATEGSPAQPAEYTNDIIFEAVSNGGINLPTVGGIAFHYAASRIRFENGGWLLVDGGSFALNADATLPEAVTHMPSRVKELSFHDGLLLVRSGKLILGNNKQNVGVGNTYPFFWDALASTLESPNGFVQYVDNSKPNQNFTAKMSISTALRDRITEESMPALVRALVSQGTNLISAWLFTDENGNTVIRTKNGVLVTLQAGDIITGDTADGTVYGDNSITGIDFTISADGVRS